MTDHNEKTVGVIGGMGPKATLDFYSKVVEKTVATHDQDHLHVIINSNPKVPNRQDALSGLGPSCAPDLIEAARSLESAGADFVVMVCNTAHAYESHIRSAIQIPFISIIEESVNRCVSVVPKLQKVGILAATGCIDANLYQKQFAKKGVDCVVPSFADQHAFMELMYRIKANDLDISIGMEMERLAQNLIDQGAEIILAACTEVPLVLHAEFLSVPLVNSTDVLVDAAVKYASPAHIKTETYTAPQHIFVSKESLQQNPTAQADALGRFVHSQLT